MRANLLLAGLVVVLAGCEKKAATPAADTTASTQTPAPSAAAGTTHEVKMELDGATYKFEPASVTIKAGDVISFVNVSGGPHDIVFYADSIPAGGAAVLDAGMPDKTAPLSGPMVGDPNAAYKVSFANAPAGVYKYYCLPHQAMGMKGEIIVQ
jgi:plastocyanin